MNITYRLCRVCKVKDSGNGDLLKLDEEELQKFELCTGITVSFFQMLLTVFCISQSYSFDP